MKTFKLKKITIKDTKGSVSLVGVCLLMFLGILASIFFGYSGMINTFRDVKDVAEEQLDSFEYLMYASEDVIQATARKQRLSISKNGNTYATLTDEESEDGTIKPSKLYEMLQTALGVEEETEGVWTKRTSDGKIKYIMTVPTISFLDTSNPDCNFVINFTMTVPLQMFNFGEGSYNIKCNMKITSPKEWNDYNIK